MIHLAIPFLRNARHRTSGFLARLAEDRRGTTIAMMCVALIPLLCVIGSGLDMARAYTVKARMQQACDAASLAGRRAMTSDTINQAVTGEATKFFNFDFPQGMFQTAAFNPVISRPRAGTVTVTASSTVPTTIMKIFGYRVLPVSVTCDASQDFENIDIALVLDNTGSMDDTMSDGNKKIQALRDAVMALYNQLKPVQDQLEANGYRVRYSIVPYSSTVNVGKLLYADDPNNIRLTSPYMRVYNYQQDNGDYDVYWYTPQITHDPNSSWYNNWNGCIEERGTVAAANNTPTATEYAAMNDMNIDLPASPGDPNTQWTPADPDAVLNSVVPASCPVQAVRLKAWTQGNLQSYVNSLTPTGSTYLDVGMVWGARFISSNGVFGDSPLLYNGMRTYKYVVFLSDGDMDPVPLSYSAWGAEQMQRRVTGGTQANPVDRAFNASAALDPTDTAKHNGRFDLLCQQVRNMPASVWTIKVSDQAMDSHLQNCANAGQSATVANKAALLAKFVEIGQAITELRLSH